MKKQHVAIYLAGSIKKGHEKSDETYWTDDDMSLIENQLKDFHLTFLNPAFRTDDLSNSISVFGRDMFQVFGSHFVFVDARDRRGLGVGAEMMWAKVNKIPVITWAPNNSHYRKDKTTILDQSVTDFVHPFIEALSDKIVDNLIEGAEWINHFLANSTIEVKGIQFIESAIKHYKDYQLDVDQPMKKLLTASEELKQRIYRSHPQVILN